MGEPRDSLRKLSHFIETEYPNVVQSVPADVSAIQSFINRDDEKVHVVFIPELSSRSASKGPSLSLKAIARRYRVSASRQVRSPLQ